MGNLTANPLLDKLRRLAVTSSIPGVLTDAANEIERLQREHDVMAATVADNINEKQRLRVMVINLGGTP